MKRVMIFLAIILSFVTISKSQNKSDIFTTKTLVWYGLDFSKAKLVGTFSEMGSAGMKSGLDMKTKYFKGWNDLFFSESKKFNLQKTFRKDDIKFDLSVIENRNSQVDENSILGYNTITLTNDDIQNIVSSYNSNAKEGIGLVFIVENFNNIKSDAFASIFVTFFDINSKKVLLTDKLVTKPAGIGLRNYWAGAIYKMLKEIEEQKYNQWRK